VAIDPGSTRSRRAILAGAAGALAATAATALERAQPVRAGDDAIQMGASNASTFQTTITTSTEDDNCFVARAHGSGLGIGGVSRDGAGVGGQTHTGDGVLGEALGPAGTGVRGVGYGDGFTRGVYGEVSSAGGVGVFGRNLATNGLAGGIQGTTDSPHGVASTGWAWEGGTGVAGVSNGSTSFPSMPAKTGVYGWTDRGAGSVGVRGISTNGRGASFAGKLAQLRLTPSSAATHPASGQAGDFFVDASGSLWFCKGATNWKHLA
jgi:hypothetical protein